MAELKKLLYVALGLMTALALTACDVDEENGDAGAAGGAGGGGDTDMGAGGEGGVGGGGGPVYSWVRVVDISDEENMAGTPGVDICGIIVDCGDGPLSGMSPTYSQGMGDLCSAMGPDCSAVRTDPAAANDNGDACDPVSMPTSDYVSLGLGGEVAVDYGQDLRGCDVTIIEHAGNDTEAYEIWVCAEASDNCLNDVALLEDADGGNSSTTVPGG